MRLASYMAALALGGVVGIWWIWQDTRDERLFAVYACAHKPEMAQVSPDEAWVRCEREIP